MFFCPAALENCGEEMDVDVICYHKSIQSQPSGFLKSTCSYSNSSPPPFLKEANANNHGEKHGKANPAPLPRRQFP
jgi:hypothetical protein